MGKQFDGEFLGSCVSLCVCVEGGGRGAEGRESIQI